MFGGVSGDDCAQGLIYSICNVVPVPALQVNYDLAYLSKYPRT